MLIAVICLLVRLSDTMEFRTSSKRWDCGHGRGRGTGRLSHVRLAWLPF